MKKALNYIYFSLFAFWLVVVMFGCSSGEKQLAKLEYKHPELFKLKDTTIYKKHDTVIYYHDTFTTPAETHTDTFNIPCPDHTAITKHFKGGSVTISVVHGKPIVTCDADSLRLVILHTDSIHYADVEREKTGLATKTVEVVKPLTWIEKFLMWTGGIFWGIIIVTVVENLFGGRILKFIASLFKPKL